MSPPRDTIFALSSGRGPAAIAVIRISGPRAGDGLKALAGRIPEPRKAAFARVRDPETREIIDEALALWFPGPNSETGEDTAELQLHGGRAVIAATFAALGRLEGFRPAEAGEFTRRGFENGKLDLTAVEGLADLVGAETEAQRRQALRQMTGRLARKAEDWRERLVRALALVEARIDFSDEADVPEDLLGPALAVARGLEAEIGAALADARRGERLREGLVVAIAGPPNAGKSTLLNRLARREAAIVSPYAGTTRDVIEVHLDLDGWPVTLLDTAGIRATEDPVELEGVRRAQARAAAADVVLWVVDASATEEGAGAAAGLPAAGQGPQPVVWLVNNKIDLAKGSNETSLSNESFDRNFDITRNRVSGVLNGRDELTFDNTEHMFNVSAVVGTGVERLVAELGRHADQVLAGSEPALVTRERQRRALEDTQAALARALAPPAAGSEDLLAEELRLAARGLGRLTGRVDVEDILDVIFRDFCIGK
jgi:tRNA modification GTPase